MKHAKITVQHLQRKAYVYVRQSTMGQVLHHQESTQRQYALREKALAFGWRPDQIRIFDGDLGQSGAHSVDRDDFKTILADVSLGEVGAVLALEASRLARSNTDWHRLIELGSLAGALIVDEDGVYDPTDFNDSLLLGLKGTMSAAELHFLRGRLQGGKLHKAERGELRIRLPVGLCWDESGRIVLDPDREVQNAVRLVFRWFREAGSAYGVVHRFAKERLKFPQRVHGGVNDGKLIWGHLTNGRVVHLLKNPAYAGVYVFGRFRGVQELLQDGAVRQRMRKMPRDAWLVEIQNHHEGYVSWEEYSQNQDQLQNNCTRHARQALPSSAREGHGLLQGLLLCGVCGRRLRIRYQDRGVMKPIYECTWRKRQGLATKSCLMMAGSPPEEAFVQRLLEVVNPTDLQWALEVQDELTQRESAVHQQWHMRLQRAQYEAELAQRRYENVEPENRLVAASLEQTWNQALQRVEEVRREMEQIGRTQLRVFTAEQRQQILELARDFPRVWNSEAIRFKDRKRMLRLLVEDITVVREGRHVRLQVRWRGGACEELRVELPGKIFEQLRYSDEQVEQVRRLAKEQTDAQIAQTLNQAGQRNTRGNPFTRSMIAWIRYKHNIPPVTLKRSEEFTVGEVAERFGVSVHVVRYWIQRKLLPTRQEEPGRPHWITLTSEKEVELARWVHESKQLQKHNSRQD